MIRNRRYGARRLFGYGLNEQGCGDGRQAGVDIFKVGFFAQAMIQQPAEQDSWDGSWQRYQVVVRHRGYPQTREPISGHASNTCGKKVTLQGGAEVLRRPSSHSSVDC